MNAIFFTQGQSLRMFDALRRHLAANEPKLERAGFYVADRAFYRDYLRERPDVDSLPVAREWDIIDRASVGEPDLNRLRQAEAQLTEGSLSRAIVADRRLLMGPLCTLRQDYRPRFSHDRQLRILEEGLTAVTELFDRVQPDVVFSFICVTFGEYLGALVARSRGIPFLNIRPTRIDNFITMATGVHEPSELVRAAYQASAIADADDDAIRDAREYLARMGSDTGAKYEGVLPVSRRPPPAAALRKRTWRRAIRFAHLQWDRSFGELRAEHHTPAPLQIMLHRRVYNPARAWWLDRGLADALVRSDQFESRTYAFFPLHTEPEITLLVHSPAYLNQIEVARHVAHSLPVGWQLLVKEHPASVGKRPRSYYEKLLAIPNLRLVDPGVDSTSAIRHASLIVTIAGSVGFEAVLRRRPVVTLGDTPYELLPDTMVRRVRALADLDREIADLLHRYRYDEASLVRYLAATIRCSARINLYSTLLGREGVYVPGAGAAGWDEAVAALATLGRQTLTRVQAGEAHRVASDQSGTTAGGEAIT